jgi:hypothetical protein
MACLLIENKNDLDFPEMRNSAVKTLGTLAAIGNKETIDAIASGAAVCLKANNNLGHQQATAVLLSALCEGADKEYIGNIISNAFPHLIELLNSTNDIVVLNTLNGLVTITEFYPQLLCNHLNVIDKFIYFLNSNNHQMVIATLAVLKNITEKVENHYALLADPNLLFTKIVYFYDKYITNFHDKNKDFADRAIVIIMNCIVKLKNRDVIHEMLDFLMKKYYSFYNEPHLSDRKIRLTSIISIIHTCVLALENTVPKEGLVSNLCKLIDVPIAVFGVEEEGLNMISSMAIAFNRAFETKSHDYWKYIQNGL